MREFLDDCLHQRGEHGRCEHVVEPTTPTRLLRIKRGRPAPYDAAIWMPDHHVQYAARQFFPDTVDVDFVHASKIKIPIHSEGQAGGRGSCSLETKRASLFLFEVFSSDAAEDLYPGGSIGLVLLEVQSVHKHRSFVRIGFFDFSEIDEDPDFSPIITNQRTVFDGCEFREFVID